MDAAERLDTTIDWLDRHKWLVRGALMLFFFLFACAVLADERDQSKEYGVILLCPTGAQIPIVMRRDVMAAIFAVFTDAITAEEFLAYIHRIRPGDDSKAHEFVVRCLGVEPM